MITKIINSILLPLMSGTMQRSESKVPKNSSETETPKEAPPPVTQKEDKPGPLQMFQTAQKEDEPVFVSPKDGFVIEDNPDFGRIELLKLRMTVTESQPFKSVQSASMPDKVTGFEKVSPSQRIIVREGTWKAVQVVNLPPSPTPPAPASPAKVTTPAEVKRKLTALSRLLCGRWGVVQGALHGEIIACFESREEARKYVRSCHQRASNYFAEVDRRKKGPAVKVMEVPGHLQWSGVGGGSPLKYALDVNNWLVFTTTSMPHRDNRCHTYRVARLTPSIKEKIESNSDSWPHLIEHWYSVEADNGHDAPAQFRAPNR